MRQDNITIAIGKPEAMEAIHHTCIASYSTYKTILSPGDWDKMKANLEDKAAFAQLWSIAVPFVCSVEGQLAGIVFLVPSGNPSALFSGDGSYIRLLGVLEGYRGRGIARLLMQACIDHARSSGEHTLALHTAGFQHAWPMYEQLGFLRIGDAGPFYGHTYWRYQLDLSKQAG